MIIKDVINGELKKHPDTFVPADVLALQDSEIFHHWWGRNINDELVCIMHSTRNGTLAVAYAILASPVVDGVIHMGANVRREGFIEHDIVAHNIDGHFMVKLDQSALEHIKPLEGE